MHGIVERDQPLLDQHHERDRRDRLRHRIDAEDRILAHRLLALDVRHADRRRNARPRRAVRPASSRRQRPVSIICVGRSDRSLQPRRRQSDGFGARAHLCLAPAWNGEMAHLIGRAPAREGYQPAAFKRRRPPPETRPRPLRGAARTRRPHRPRPRCSSARARKSICLPRHDARHGKMRWRSAGSAAISGRNNSRRSSRVEFSPVGTMRSIISPWP